MTDESRRPPYARDGWWADGRVPGPTGWRTLEVGPYATPAEAGAAARERRLGGVRVYRVEHGRRRV